MQQMTEVAKELLAAADLWRPYLIRRLGGPEHADEAVQELRERVWWARGRFDESRADAGVWVGGFARLIALEQIRQLRQRAEIPNDSLDTIGVGVDAVLTPSVDDHRRLVQTIARHVSAADWEAVMVRTHERSSTAEEAASLGLSVDAYRGALRRVQAVAETVRAVLWRADGGRPLSREELRSSVCPRWGVGEVLAWIDGDEDAARTAAAQLGISLSAARNRLSAARRLFAIAKTVAEEVTG